MTKGKGPVPGAMNADDVENGQDRGNAIGSGAETL
jgi:hypothetical protein